MDAVLFGVFAAGVQEYLRRVMGTVAAGAATRSAGAVPAEVARLAAAWRALLRQHALGPDGRCVVCGEASRTRDGVARWLPRRRPAGLCTVWQVAVAYFIRQLPGVDP
ncbi:hypothetical protein [Amycolatopsis benzoatilytica]|uniref:hypothetical protein n=1 Tax=Amycolatopsis benzoatilytica TaxID=346045 RepID=UPI00039D35FA|nr:hypothetical protein [Amycolatopsis benzoatilytica]